MMANFTHFLHEKNIPAVMFSLSYLGPYVNIFF
jgi:hypothetical protein